MVVAIVVFAVVFADLRVVVAFLLILPHCLWDRVITMTSPWVASQDPAYR